MRVAPVHPAPLTKRERRDLRVLGAFIQLYCRHRHDASREPFRLDDVDVHTIFGRRVPHLCAECTSLLSHGVVKRLRCEQVRKPMCKDCSCQCYSEHHRESIREVMRFSGPRMILRGRLHYLFHLR